MKVKWTPWPFFSEADPLLIFNDTNIFESFCLPINRCQFHHDYSPTRNLYGGWELGEGWDIKSNQYVTKMYWETFVCHKLLLFTEDRVLWKAQSPCFQGSSLHNFRLFQHSANNDQNWVISENTLLYSVLVLPTVNREEIQTSIRKWVKRVISQIVLFKHSGT